MHTNNMEDFFKENGMFLIIKNIIYINYKSEVCTDVALHNNNDTS